MHVHACSMYTSICLLFTKVYTVKSKVSVIYNGGNTIYLMVIGNVR